MSEVTGHATRGLGRRRVLGLSAGLIGAATVASPALASARSRPHVPYPFLLGVASGEPRPGGVVLWTRLASEPLAEDGSGGMAPRDVVVSWQVAEDERMQRVVRSGAVRTGPDLGHSVHLDVNGLRPAREYWYRFRVGPHVSPVGRTRTAPNPATRLTAMTFAFASCQSFGQGWFTPYEHMVADDPDLVLFLGDYIYCQPAGPVAYPGNPVDSRVLAPPRRCETLGDFRARYATYHTDPHLQEAHRLLPWSVTIDDNEIQNDFWADPDPAAVERAGAGYQAFWENMPLSAAQRPRGASLPGSYRRLDYGDLATFHMIDSRQYRTKPPLAVCSPADRPDGYCPDTLDPNSSVLGDAQEAWLLDGLSAAATTWNVLGNQFAFTQRDGDGRLDPPESRDLGGGWDRYVADRQTILDHVRTRDIRNLVIVTGDSHRNWVLNTPRDYRTWDAAVPPVCTEFMVTSITSGGERDPKPSHRPQASTPHLLYRDQSHGYGLVTLSPSEWRTDYRAVSTIWAPSSSVSTISSWTVRPDQPGANPA